MGSQRSVIGLAVNKTLDPAARDYRWIDRDRGSDRLLSYDLDADSGFLWMRSRALHEKVKARYPE